MGERDEGMVPAPRSAPEAAEMAGVGIRAGVV